MKLFKNDVDAFNNLVFEKRNRAYGAYAIRASYNLNAIKSTLITGGSFMLLMFVLYSFSGGKNISEQKNFYDAQSPPLVIGTLEIDKQPKPEQKQKPLTASAAPNIPIIPVVDNLASENNNARTNEQLADPGGNSTNKNSNGTALIGDTANTGRQVEGTVPVVVTPSVVPTVIYAEVMPKLDGIGPFIQRNIVYPSNAIDMEVDGVVYTQFIVDEDGNITDVKVTKGIGYGCDEEAIRVVKIMPKWSPGKVGSKPVRVIFNLPIRFKLAH